MDEDLLKELKVSCRLYQICLYLLLGILLSSCAKLGYVLEQGIGQLSIQWSAKANHKVLADPKIDEKVKDKIRAIIKAKAFFEELYQVKLDDIYEKTTFLDREAVSYMVTASPIDQIKPHSVSFPFVGRFPYLAFFKKKSAHKFAAKLEKKELVTWMRPVHAYSSLNYFDDRILSSFFVFTELQLAELVFHELTHLTLFVKNNVGFNESLAQFVAHKTLEIYLKGRAEGFLKARRMSRRLSQDLVPMIHKLNALYQKSAEKGESADTTRENFLVDFIFPRFQKYCDETHKKCDLKTSNWNNARMVGYLNYEQTYERIEKNFISNKEDIVRFVRRLTKLNQKFQDSKSEEIAAISFLEFMEQQK